MKLGAAFRDRLLAPSLRRLVEVLGVLLIDSNHTVKRSSEMNNLVLEVLPWLADGERVARCIPVAEDHPFGRASLWLRRLA